jgi:hypothetical protein
VGFLALLLGLGMLGVVAIVGNVVGGLGLVTLLRLLRLPHKVIEARDGEEPEPG